MTVGQRIAQKRKELGLSQEGLGERLGVSRQAIYKWESDAALPEIEKLVNLSREFSVSVDWLLGEEDRDERPGELTPEQLRMVEEIVGRYLAARPPEARETAEAPEAEIGPDREPENPKKRRRWPYVLGALAVLAVFWNLFSQLNEMKDQYRTLQNSIEYVRYSVDSQINGIAYRVESILESQNRLTAEQSAEITATDYRANTITISARALPRTYVEGMTAEFLLTSDGETVTVPGRLGEDHAFTAEVTGPLSDDVSVTVVLLTGDQRETQLLEQFTGLYTGSFPDAYVMNGLWGSGSRIDEYATVHIGTEDAALIDSIRLGLFRDGKLLVWYEHLDEQPENFHGDWGDTEFFRLEGEWDMEPGHEYCQVAVVVDEYGRERVYPDHPVAYDPEEKFANHVGAAEMSNDPADWDY